MKKILIALVLAAGVCCAAEQKKDAYDIRPGAAKAADAPTSTDWQTAHAAELAAATSADVLEGFVKDASAADALLAAVKPDFATDPLKACQIAAVTQYVMADKGGCPVLAALAFWNWFGETPRELWSARLLAAAEKATATDVKMYFLDQLRWCGFPCQAARVRALGKGACPKLAEFTDWVASELDGSAAVRAGF